MREYFRHFIGLQAISQPAFNLIRQLKKTGILFLGFLSLHHCNKPSNSNEKLYLREAFPAAAPCDDQRPTQIIIFFYIFHIKRKMAVKFEIIT